MRISHNTDAKVKKKIVINGDTIFVKTYRPVSFVNQRFTIDQFQKLNQNDFDEYCSTTNLG